MPLLYGIRHAWPEQAGFCLNRRNGYPGYSFVHFLTSVEIVIDGVRTVTPNHACIIYAPGTPQYFIARQPLVHDWFHFPKCRRYCRNAWTSRWIHFFTHASRN